MQTLISWAGKSKYLLKKYLPDIIILGGLLWFLCHQYRFPISDWQLVGDTIEGTFLGYRYEWQRILSIMLMVIGLDIAIRRFVAVRKNRLNVM